MQIVNVKPSNVNDDRGITEINPEIVGGGRDGFPKKRLFNLAVDFGCSSYQVRQEQNDDSDTDNYADSDSAARTCAGTDDDSFIRNGTRRNWNGSTMKI